MRKREQLREQHGREVALVLKVSPDLDDMAIRDVATTVRRERIDGLIVGNTTVLREGVAGLPHGDEEGGLSGEPLRPLALGALPEVLEIGPEPLRRLALEGLAKFAARLRNEIPLIACGGIMSGEDARERFRAGAALVQVYSGLVYRGPRLVTECVAAFS